MCFHRNSALGFLRPEPMGASEESPRAGSYETRDATKPMLRFPQLHLYIEHKPGIAVHDNEMTDYLCSGNHTNVVAKYRAKKSCKHCHADTGCNNYNIESYNAENAN